MIGSFWNSGGCCASTSPRSTQSRHDAWRWRGQVAVGSRGSAMRFHEEGQSMGLTTVGASPFDIHRCKQAGQGNDLRIFKEFSAKASLFCT